MNEENNSDSGQITSPAQPDAVYAPPQMIDQSQAAPDNQPTSINTETPPQPTQPKKKFFRFRNIAILFVLILLFGGATSGAYYMGKKNRITVFKAPTPQPINLPPQTVVTANCLVGRGKQYILPKDIPIGPIYDVVGGKVIAIEYNVNLVDVNANPDNFSNTLLKLTRDYPVDHFSLVPVAPKPGDTSLSAHLIMFVVSKAEAAAITCAGEKA